MTGWRVNTLGCIALSAVILAASTSCEGEPELPRPTTVTVSPAEALLTFLGDSVQFTASVADQNGQLMDGVVVRWSSSNASVAEAGSAGLVTARRDGEATISATVEGVSGTAAVTVAREVTMVAVAPAEDTLVFVGDTARLSARAEDAAGHEIEGREVVWASSDTAVASAGSAGLVTARRDGEATISATVEGVSGTAAVTVAREVTMVAVAPAEDTLVFVGDTARLSARAEDAAGHEIEGREVVWASSDTAVASVGSAGLVTARRDGEATVSATVDGVSGTAEVTVAREVSGVAVAPAADTLAFVGDTVRLAARVEDAAGHVIEGREVRWASSDTAVAAVDSAGLVTAGHDGDATVSATVEGVSGAAAMAVVLSGRMDRSVLAALYEATEGANWTRDDKWLSDAPTGEWYGVITDSAGHVTEIDLGDNGLSGELPDAIGRLNNLTILNVENNDLRGPLPFTLTSLSLRELRFAGTELCVATNDAYRAWMETVETVESTGVDCTVSSDREILTALYHATGGPNWKSNHNWLTDKPLGEWHGVRTDGTGRVVRLVLGNNNLRGTLPPELGHLSELEYLTMNLNELHGPIPPELGALTALRDLRLQRNRFTGRVPPELGLLSELEVLYLHGRLTSRSPGPYVDPKYSLSGPIPPEPRRYHHIS